MSIFADPDRLARVPPGDFAAIQKLQLEWAGLLGKDLFRLDGLCDEII